MPAQLSLRALGRRAVNQQGAGGSHCETTECRALSPPALEVVGCLGARQCSGQGLCCGNARLCCNGMAPPFHLTCKQPVKSLSQGASERVGKGKVCCCCARVGQQDKEIGGTISEMHCYRCLWVSWLAPGTLALSKGRAWHGL